MGIALASLSLAGIDNLSIEGFVEIQLRPRKGM